LLSKNTLTASGARWEISCSIEEAVPVIGLWIHKDDHSEPPEMAGRRKIDWTWDGIAGFLGGL